MPRTTPERALQLLIENATAHVQLATAKASELRRHYHHNQPAIEAKLTMTLNCLHRATNELRHASQWTPAQPPGDA